MSVPSLAEVEHADWPALQRMCEVLGLNPKGRSAVVRMRVLDHVRHRTHPERWRVGTGHVAPLLTRLGFPDLARRLWESTIQLSAPAPWVGLGDADLAAGQLASAAKAFGRAVQMGDPTAELHRAEALAADGDFEGAARSCDAFLASRPGDVRALVMKSGFLTRAGFVDEALHVLETTVQAHPQISGLARLWGVALMKAGRPDPAVKAFEEAGRRDPRDVSARINRAAALLVLGRTPEGVEALQEALQIDSRRAEALNNLGVAYLQGGRARSGVTNLERAAKQLELPLIVRNLGKAREALAGRKRLVSNSGEDAVEPGPSPRPKSRARKSKERPDPGA